LKSAYEHLDLFSGIGGFALAARWNGLRTIQFVEYEPYAQKVLRKNFPDVPIHDDIKDFNATKFQRPFLCTGSWPCQPFSRAGKRRGKTDDRYLWPEMLRVIRECRPTWILGENVIEVIKMALDEVLTDLEKEGYSCRTFVIPACAVQDMRHRRDRVWVVGHSNGKPLDMLQHESSAKGGTETSSERFPQSGNTSCDEYRMQRTGYISECGMDRVTDGTASRLDRMRVIGNSIVPQVASEIIRAMVRSS